MVTDRFPLSVPIFVFEENQNVNNDKKIWTDRNDQTLRLRPWSQKRHGYRVLNFWTRTSESICLSFCLPNYLCIWFRLPILFTNVSCEIKYFQNISCNKEFIHTYAHYIWSIGPPHLTNMNKITFRQAAIDSSMPGDFKKCN